MRTTLWIACLLAAAFGPFAAAADHPDPRIESLDWLLGRWNRTDLAEGRAGHEHWRKEGATLTGIGAMQRDGCTVFEERLRIEAGADALYYVATVPGNAGPIRFRLTDQADKAVVFENPEHDFPQRIAYRREGDRLHADVSGSGRDITFAFERDASGAFPSSSTRNDEATLPPMHNIINWFEIPAADFDRALLFYSAVLDASLDTMELGGTRMGMFPNDGHNVSGAIVQGDDYAPGAQGPLLYLSGGNDLSPMLGRVEAAGGTVLVPKTRISEEFGWFALFIDSEGNRIGLHSPN